MQKFKSVQYRHYVLKSTQIHKSGVVDVTVFVSKTLSFDYTGSLFVFGEENGAQRNTRQVKTKRLSIPSMNKKKQKIELNWL